MTTAFAITMIVLAVGVVIIARIVDWRDRRTGAASDRTEPGG